MWHCARREAPRKICNFSCGRPMSGVSPTPLKRVIGFWGGSALIVGITIGSGIFRKPPTIAALVPNPLAIMALWFAIGAISLIGALAIAELSSMLPQTGGVFVYLHEAFGDAAAFVFGWVYLLVATPATLGALATVFAEFALDFSGAPLGTDRTPLIATAAIVLLTVINITGAKAGSAIQNLFTFIKVAALLAVVVGAFAFGHGSFSHQAAGPVSSGGLSRAVASVMWAFDGWIAVSMIAGEVVAPERLMRRVIVSGMLTIIVLYLGANLAYFYVFPIDALKSAGAGVAPALMSGIAGPAAGKAISLGILCSVFGALNGNILAKSRVPFAMAQKGLTFAFLGRSHPRWGTPWAATVIQSIVAIGLVFVLKDFDKMTTYFIVIEWFALIFSVLALFVLRRKRPDLPRPFRTPGYPWLSAIFVVGTTVGLAAIVWGEMQIGNYSPLVGLGLALLGFPVFALRQRFTTRAKSKCA